MQSLSIPHRVEEEYRERVAEVTAERDDLQSRVLELEDVRAELAEQVDTLSGLRGERDQVSGMWLSLAQYMSFFTSEITIFASCPPRDAHLCVSAAVTSTHFNTARLGALHVSLPSIPTQVVNVPLHSFRRSVPPQAQCPPPFAPLLADALSQEVAMVRTLREECGSLRSKLTEVQCGGSACIFVFATSHGVVHRTCTRCRSLDWLADLVLHVCHCYPCRVSLRFFMSRGKPTARCSV